METENTAAIDPNSLSAQQLAGSAALGQQALTRACTALEAAYAAQERGALPVYQETTESYESRQRETAAAVEAAKAAAQDALYAQRRQRDVLRQRLSGPSGLGLTSREWEAAGSLSSLTVALTAGASLGAVAGHLRGALAAADRPRMAALLGATEQRLRDPGGQRDEPGEQAAVQTLLSEIRGQLRDTTLDQAKSELQELQAAIGETEAALSGPDAGREAVRALYGRLGVHRLVEIPSEEESIANDRRHRVQSQSGALEEEADVAARDRARRMASRA